MTAFPPRSLVFLLPPPVIMRPLLSLIAMLFLLAPARAADLPNLVIMLVDDMGVMDTSVPFLTDEAVRPKRYPLNELYRTPSMERLAAKGVRFNQFYAMSVCSPTRISIQTGQNAARHRTTNWINPWENNRGTQGPPDWNWEGLKKGDTTLAALLRERGYRTIHSGKGHFGPEETDGADPSNLGFDINLAGRSIGAPGSYFGEKNYGSGGKRARSAVPGLESYHGTDTFLTEALTIETNKLVDAAVKEEKPFFLYFAHYAVHAPFETDPRFAAHYADSGLNPNAVAFATLIEGMDKSLGDLLDQLEASGVAENTLVFFLGDNGSDAPLGDQHVIACAAPLRGKKGAHYEGGMRVPFIASWAAPDPENPWQKKLPIASGSVQGQVANVTDLFPTILGLVGGAPDPDKHPVDGRDLAKLLTGAADPGRPAQFLMHYPHGPHRSNYFTVWRDGDWKLIHHALPEIPTHGGFLQFEGGEYQLFNLADDPFEQKNLAAEKPEELKRMVAALRAELERMEAVHPVDAEGKPIVPGLSGAF